MAEQSKESSMEEILSSIKRIIAEDKAIEVAEPSVVRKQISKPKLQAVPDIDVDAEEVLELTEEVALEPANSAHGVFGDRRKDERLIDDNKLDSMRQSLSSLVGASPLERNTPTSPAQGTSLEDLTREMMRPMLKQWLDDNLPELVEELVAREIARLGRN